MNSTSGQTNLGAASPMSHGDWVATRYNWYRACGLLDDLPQRTTETAIYQRSPDPPPKPHLKWYPLSKPEDDIATTYQQPVATTQRHRYSQRVKNVHPQTISTPGHAEKVLRDDPRTWSRGDWAIARYNWYRACGLLDDSPQRTGEVATYQRSIDPPPPKPCLKWYPLSKPDDHVVATYQRPVVPTPPAPPTRKYCQRVEHAHARAMLARYQAETEEKTKGTGQPHPFVESEHDRFPAGQSNGGQFRAMNQGNGSSSARSRLRLRRADTLRTGTGEIWEIDGRPWELTKEQVKDWDAITSRGAWSEGFNAAFPLFWTSIPEFEAEIRRQARSYRDQILRVEGSAVDANPLDLAKRQNDRARAALQQDFAEAATTVDNLTFVAGLAKAPLKLGVKALTTTAERQAAAAIAAEARSLAASRARSTLTPPVGTTATLSGRAATKTATRVEANSLRTALKEGDSSLGTQLRQAIDDVPDQGMSGKKDGLNQTVANHATDRDLLASRLSSSGEKLLEGGLDAAQQFDDTLSHLFMDSQSGEFQGIWLHRDIQYTQFSDKDLAIYFQRADHITGRVVGEEVQHAIDFTMGATSSRITAEAAAQGIPNRELRQWWHRRVFVRELQNIHSNRHGMGVLQNYSDDVYRAYQQHGGKLTLQQILTRKFDTLY